VLDLLGHPQVNGAALHAAFPWLGDVSPRAAAELATQALYAGYLHRQEADIRAFRREEGVPLPPVTDYLAIGGLSAELREKLAKAQPASLGAAARIQGMTPAALAALAAFARRAQVQSARGRMVGGDDGTVCFT
jgi:tRNA uridine 5-carboxymethylaminomethyl modification enzyme